MNALFDLKFNLSVSDRTIVVTATATAVFLAALVAPTPPRLVSTTATQAQGAKGAVDDQYLQRMQRRLDEKIAENTRYYGIAAAKALEDNPGEENGTGNEMELDGDGLEADLSSGNKDTCVLEVRQNTNFFEQQASPNYCGI